MVQAVLMGFFIRLFERSSTTVSPADPPPSQPLLVPDVYLYGAAICIVFLISIFIDHNFFHHGYRMRVAATSLIYRKVGVDTDQLIMRMLMMMVVVVVVVVVEVVVVMVTALVIVMISLSLLQL